MEELKFFYAEVEELIEITQCIYQADISTFDFEFSDILYQTEFETHQLMNLSFSRNLIQSQPPPPKKIKTFFVTALNQKR